MSESSREPPNKEDNGNLLTSQFNDNSKDNKILKKIFVPIVFYLNSNNIKLKDLPNYVQLLKSYSYKNKKNGDQNSNNMLTKKEFTEIFKTLYQKTKDCNYILDRSLNRMNCHQRNILFAYFSLKYKNEMKDIASKNFTDFEFNSRISDKIGLSKEWEQYIDKFNSIKNDQIHPVIRNVDLERNCTNNDKNDFSIERDDNQENQNDNLPFDNVNNDNNNFSIVGVDNQENQNDNFPFDYISNINDYFVNSFDDDEVY